LLLNSSSWGLCRVWTKWKKQRAGQTKCVRCWE